MTPSLNSDKLVPFCFKNQLRRWGLTPVFCCSAHPRNDGRTDMQLEAVNVRQYCQRCSRETVLSEEREDAANTRKKTRVILYSAQQRKRRSSSIEQPRNVRRTRCSPSVLYPSHTDRNKTVCWAAVDRDNRQYEAPATTLAQQAQQQQEAAAAPTEALRTGTYYTKPTLAAELRRGAEHVSIARLYRLMYPSFGFMIRRRITQRG